MFPYRLTASAKVHAASGRTTRSSLRWTDSPSVLNEDSIIHSSEPPGFLGRCSDASDFIPPLYTSPHFIPVSIFQYRRYPQSTFHTCFAALGMWGRVDMRYHLAP